MAPWAMTLLPDFTPWTQLVGPSMDASLKLGQVKPFLGIFLTETENVGESFVLVEDVYYGKLRTIDGSIQLSGEQTKNDDGDIQNLRDERGYILVSFLVTAACENQLLLSWLLSLSQILGGNLSLIMVNYNPESGS